MNLTHGSERGRGEPLGLGASLAAALCLGGFAAACVRVVYIGEEGVDGAPSIDPFVNWVLNSDYWGILQEYGVNAGSFDGSTRVPTSSVFLPGMVQNKLIPSEVLDARILEILHPSLDGGPGDSGADGGGPLIPRSWTYLFVLPDNVNVSLPEGGQTCIQALGYHDHDGKEPYIIIPPCKFGRSPMTIAHELAEMATDPLPYAGWYSNADEENAGGEIGDLCNVPVRVLGWTVTQLWSNTNGMCVPTP